MEIPRLILLLLLLALPAEAEELKFSWPLSCTQGENCWIVNYADEDPSPATHDFTCGTLSYDAHDGTDIALRDHRAIAENVPVRAAAAGTVLRTRDGVADHDGGKADLAAAKESGEECGNGVVIDHGGGWQTLYCHMKQGSIRAHPGQKVAAGDALGAVGQTGMAAFAHLHFGVKHDGKNIDPFTGDVLGTAGCDDPRARSLWAAPVAYDPLMLYAAGFSDRPPEADAVFSDTSSPEKLPAASPALIFWFAAYGMLQGDRIEITITGPDGKIWLDSKARQESRKIRLFRFAGARTARKPLRPGVYVGRATVTRGALARRVEQRIVIE